MPRAPHSVKRFVPVIAFILASTSIACGPTRSRQLVVPELVATRVALPFRTEEYRLPNGLRVVLDEDHTSQSVAVCVTYQVGSRDDPAGRAGLAHLVEHAMFEGSENVRPQEHRSLLEDAGAATINAFTSPDRTQYVEVVPPNALELVMWLESDRMATGTSRLGQAELDKVRRIVEEEHALYFDEGIVSHQAEFGALFPPGHPYHRIVVGEMTDLERVTLTDVQALRAAYYGPSNATLVLVGDFERARARGQIERWFGSLAPTHAHPDRYGTIPPQPLLPAEHREVHIDLRANLPAEVRVAWAVPPTLSQRTAAVDVALAKLRDDAERKLEQRGHATRATTFQFSGDLAGLAELRFEARPGLSLQEILDALEQTQEDLYGWDEAMVSRSNTSAVTRVLAFEPFAQRSMAYAEASQIAGSAQALPRAFNVHLVDADDAFEARRTYFATSSRVVVRVASDPTAPPSGRVARTW